MWRHLALDALEVRSSDGYLNLMLLAIIRQRNRGLVERQRDTVEY